MTFSFDLCGEGVSEVFFFLFLVFGEFMELKNRAVYASVWAALVVVLLSSSLVLAGDIVHHDDVAPKRPGCDNNFVLVKL